MSAIRAAVVGCGDVSVVHLDAIAKRQGTELVGIAETDPGRRAAAAERRGVPGFATVEELLDAVRPDVVHVCTPHDQHAPVAIAALRAGASVLVEKPLADTIDAARELAAVLSESPGQLALCFQNRYNPPVRALQELIGSDALGRIEGAAATVLWHRTPEYYRDRPWRGTWSGGGGGLLMNQAIHTLDLLNWLLGPVEEVKGSASTRALADVIEVEDTAEMALRHASGVRSVFFATLGHGRNSDVEIEIVGERATATLRGDLTVRYADGRVMTVPERTATTGGQSYWGLSHELLIDDFHSRLSAPEPFWIGVDAGLDTLTTIAAVYDASFPQRGVVAEQGETE